ncbi:MULTISPECIES: FixH family protein [unclassified Paenibacillus]|uniref:FixH family protein n=1 Tax=unclassified Paenibacillus TaxID=185978 RepID=UPI001C109B22|nr:MULTISPECIES: FixH family protein [unclassified Paenibacillus]MBU5443085.1 FixH family protein [Paenibacillus sp. MSJ-34]CAH0122258.1 hypothetical protein PAE9249_04806 [Paenibacillus sp. CECT 9249]
MKKYSFLLAGLVLLLLVSACSDSGTAEPSEPLQVEISTVQDILQPGRAILIDATVTQGAEKVTDAQEVEFEIWRKDQEKHRTVTAKHWLDGTYRIKTMFPEDGVYYVVAHVTSGDMQAMPKKELVVGNVTAG